MSTLSLTVQPEADGAVLISPHGEIDADNAHEIREEVSGLLATSTPVSIKVDLGGVSFIDSVGIGALVGCYHAAAASNVRFVVVNPTAFAGLQRRGQQVVVTHEATSVAIRATTTRPVPLWLSEGMADFVGYRDVDATEQQVAAALFAQVRAGRGPTALPRPEEFDPAHATIGPTYNAAWLAVRQIAERYGTVTLVRFYRAAASASSADASASAVDAAAAGAFRDVLHTTVAAFTRQWLAAVRAAARG